MSGHLGEKAARITSFLKLLLHEVHDTRSCDTWPLHEGVVALPVVVLDRSDIVCVCLHRGGRLVREVELEGLGPLDLGQCGSNAAEPAFVIDMSSKVMEKSTERGGIRFGINQEVSLVRAVRRPLEHVERSTHGAGRGPRVHQ